MPTGIRSRSLLVAVIGILGTTLTCFHAITIIFFNRSIDRDHVHVEENIISKQQFLLAHGTPTNTTKVGGGDKNNNSLPRRETLLTSTTPQHRVQPVTAHQKPGEVTSRQTSSAKPDRRENVVLKTNNDTRKHDRDDTAFFFQVDPISMKRQNHYSGMYWTSRDVVMRLNPQKQHVFAAASVDAFDVADSVWMPYDWLDCCVEHLSKLGKHFIENKRSYKRDTNQGTYTFRRLAEIISSYVVRTGSSSSYQLPGIETSPARETIAVLPLYENEEEGQTQDSLISFVEAQPKLKERVAVLTMYSIAATLASLWQNGIGRAVIVGRTQQPSEMVKAAFTVATNFMNKNSDSMAYISSPMELAYAWGMKDTNHNSRVILMPKIATEMLQSAFKGTLEPSDLRTFAGDDPNRWKYVYFSEPDLILHSRSTAFAEMRQHLNQGGAIAAIRLQVMPHEIDFPEFEDQRLLVPNVGHFGNFQDLDPDTDACCDAGKYWPGMDDYIKCEHLRFYQCGFQAGDRYNEQEANEAHKRLQKYPMIRLKKTGFGILLVQNHGRYCRPGKRGECSRQNQKKR